jgi:hypothetical protein
VMGVKETGGVWGGFRADLAPWHPPRPRGPRWPSRWGATQAVTDQVWCQLEHHTANGRQGEDKHVSRKFIHHTTLTDRSQCSSPSAALHRH